MPTNETGIETIRAVADTIWKRLAEAEEAAGLPFKDITIRSDSPITVTAHLYGGDVDCDAAEVAASVRWVSDAMEGSFETSGPYACSAQPSGQQVGVRAHFERDGVQFTVKALIDADAYEKSRPRPAEVAA